MHGVLGLGHWVEYVVSVAGDISAFHDTYRYYMAFLRSLNNLWFFGDISDCETYMFGH